VTLAALDLGTNSTRLLVAETDPGAPGGFRTLDRRMRITRMGAGVDADRRLAADAVARVLDALGGYRQAMDELGVDRVRAVATSAARDAANRDELFDAVEATIGARPELLSGEEEARLSFDGATADLDAPAPYLVVDIGGGSTEFVLGRTEPEGITSIDVGCVRITEQFLASDPPAPEELSNALDVIRLHLDDVVVAIPHIRSARTVVGLAGTISTAAAVELGLASYDRDRIHHFRLTRAAAEDVFRTLATERADDRRHNPGLEAERVDVIVGGMLVLVAFMRHFDVTELLVSEADILDGLVRSLQ
jgi:exopolyphosphatase / guanosine-5'-triphosphate,3'-diphosphate pyrophosphatase